MRVSETHFTTTSPVQTEQLGAYLGAALRAGDIICLSGDLGAGKTAFARGLGAGWGATEAVNSPTFVIAHEHRRTIDTMRLIHIDCYRLSSANDAESIGIEDILAGEDAVIIEWPERIAELLPNARLWVHIEAGERPDNRRLTFTASGERAAVLLAVLDEAL